MAKDEKKANLDVEWTYERVEGDIVIFAPNAAAALAGIRAHGFLILDPKRLKQTSSIPPDSRQNVKKEGIS